TPDGHSRLKLMKFLKPAVVRAEPTNAPANTLGIRRIMFAVDDLEEVLTRLRAHGAELLGEVVQYEGQIPALLCPRPRGDHRCSGRAAQLSVRPISVLEERAWGQPKCSSRSPQAGVVQEWRLCL